MVIQMLVLLLGLLCSSPMNTQPVAIKDVKKIPGEPLSPEAHQYLKGYKANFSSAWVLDAHRFVHQRLVMDEDLALEVLDMPPQEKNNLSEIDNYYNRRLYFLTSFFIPSNPDPEVRNGLLALKAALFAARYTLKYKRPCIYVARERAAPARPATIYPQSAVKKRRKP